LPTDSEREVDDVQANDGWALAEAALALAMEDARESSPAIQNLLLYGPPGTGKSHFAQRHGIARAGAEVCRVYLTEDSPAADLRGGPLPDGREWHWVHGPAVRAWQAGRRLVLDEVDKASADALTFLLAILDDRAVAGFVLPNGETVAPSAGFHVVATTNAEPWDLPEALRDRFSVAIELNEPHPEAIAALPRDLRRAARVTAGLEPDRRLSIRSWRAFAHARTRHGEELAAQLVFGARAADVLDAMSIGADAEDWDAIMPSVGEVRGW
jgi:MoxR-like ATPase